MKLVRSLIFCASLLLMNSCDLIPGLKEKPSPEEDPKVEEEALLELYETGNDNFPLLAIDDSGNMFGFSEGLDSLYLRFPNEDEWMMSYDENHLPTSAYVKHDDGE